MFLIHIHAECSFSPVTHRTREIAIDILFGSHLSRPRTIGEGGRVAPLSLVTYRVRHAQPKVSNGSQVFLFPVFIQKSESVITVNRAN